MYYNPTYMMDIENRKNEILSFIKGNNGRVDSVDITKEFDDNAEFTIKCLNMLFDENQIEKNGITNNYRIKF